MEGHGGQPGVWASRKNVGIFSVSRRSTGRCAVDFVHWDWSESGQGSREIASPKACTTGYRGCTCRWKDESVQWEAI